MNNETRAICMAQLVMSSGKHPGNINPVDVKAAYDVLSNIESEIETREQIRVKVNANRIATGVREGLVSSK
jgi:hypothetical protein